MSEQLVDHVARTRFRDEWEANFAVSANNPSRTRVYSKYGRICWESKENKRLFTLSCQ